MSAREYAYMLVDELDDEQLDELIIMIKGLRKKEKNKDLKPEEVRGILSEYANPDLISSEKNAWERAAAEKYENS